MLDDFRVDQSHQRIAPIGHVDHDDALVHIDLGGRQADPGRRVHGFSHVAHQLPEAFVEHGHRSGDLVESGVGVAQNVENRHMRMQFSLLKEQFTCRISSSM